MQSGFMLAKCEHSEVHKVYTFAAVRRVEHSMHRVPHTANGMASHHRNVAWQAVLDSATAAQARNKQHSVRRVEVSGHALIHVAVHHHLNGVLVSHLHSMMIGLEHITGSVPTSPPTSQPSQHTHNTLSCVLQRPQDPPRAHNTQEICGCRWQQDLPLRRLCVYHCTFSCPCPSTARSQSCRTRPQLHQAAVLALIDDATGPLCSCSWQPAALAAEHRITLQLHLALSRPSLCNCGACARRSVAQALAPRPRITLQLHAPPLQAAPQAPCWCAASWLLAASQGCPA